MDAAIASALEQLDARLYAAEARIEALERQYRPAERPDMDMSYEVFLTRLGEGIVALSEAGTIARPVTQ